MRVAYYNVEKGRYECNDIKIVYIKYYDIFSYFTEISKDSENIKINGNYITSNCGLNIELVSKKKYRSYLCTGKVKYENIEMIILFNTNRIYNDIDSCDDVEITKCNKCKKIMYKIFL